MCLKRNKNQTALGYYGDPKTNEKYATAEHRKK